MNNYKNNIRELTSAYNDVGLILKEVNSIFKIKINNFRLI
jgi:hypothetical protein